MTERREPTISSAPMDSREEPARARVQKNNPLSGDSERKANRPPPTPVSARPVVVRSPLGPLALIFTLLVGLFAGFTYWSQTQNKQAQQQMLAQLRLAEGRVSELEKRLMLSDDESTQSLTVIQAKVKENEAEVRKLWGVAYDRNRKAIIGLDESVDKLQKSLTALDGRTKKSLDEVIGEVSVVSELVEAQQSAINKADQVYRAQQASYSQLQQKLESLENDLRKKVLTNEEAIKAIDAFRLQVNRELLKLKGG